MTNVYRHIEVKRHGDILCVRLLQHQLDDVSIRAISDEMHTLIDRENCQKLVLALGQLKCLYSVLIARLIKLRRALNERGGRLKICDVTEEAMSVFESCQLHDYFDFAKDETAALAALQR